MKFPVRGGLLGQDGPYFGVRGIDFYDELETGVVLNQDGSRDKVFFEVLEGLCGFGVQTEFLAVKVRAVSRW